MLNGNIGLSFDVAQVGGTELLVDVVLHWQSDTMTNLCGGLWIRLCPAAPIWLWCILYKHTHGLCLEAKATVTTLSLSGRIVGSGHATT